jgi:hypothetical protein
MIDVKQAVKVATEKAADLLGQRPFNLEEIERESYKGSDAWVITLSFVADPDQTSPLSTIVTSLNRNLKYKRFFIDPETSELLAMKVREVEAQ